MQHNNRAAIQLKHDLATEAQCVGADTEKVLQQADAGLILKDAFPNHFAEAMQDLVRRQEEGDTREPADIANDIVSELETGEQTTRTDEQLMRDIANGSEATAARAIRQLRPGYSQALYDHYVNRIQMATEEGDPNLALAEIAELPVMDDSEVDRTSVVEAMAKARHQNW